MSCLCLVSFLTQSYFCLLFREPLYETIDRQFGYARGILRRYSEGSSKNAPLLLPYRWRVILEIARSRILAAGSRKIKDTASFFQEHELLYQYCGVL